MNKPPKPLAKPPEDMTKDELIRALQDARAMLWEARNTIRILVAQQRTGEK